MFVVINK